MMYLVDGLITKEAPENGVEDSGTILLSKFGIIKKTVVGKKGEWKVLYLASQSISKISFATKGDLINYYRKKHRILLNGVPIKEKTKTGGFKLFSKSW